MIGGSDIKTHTGPWIIAVALCLALPPAWAADAPKPDDDKNSPYLTPAAEPDEAALLPAPPAKDSAEAQAERALFESTRSLKDTPRWTLAIGDADRKPKAVWRDFGCALGSEIRPKDVPAVIDLLGRLNDDVEQATDGPKDKYKRARPLVGNEAPLCVDRTPKLTNSFSFPSGHATQGWATALVLAELAPDRATALLARGKVFGESRIVCGVHWKSDVEAARTAAAILVATLHGNQTFRSDLDTARQELAAARAAAPASDAAACRLDADAASTPLQ